MLPVVNGYTGRYSDNRYSDKVRVDPGSGWVGSWFWGRQGQSERFRCVGITLAEIYENTTSRRNSSYDQRRRGPKKYPS